MLETQFPRPLGDIGNAHTWPFPVHYRVVSGASAKIVVEGDNHALIDAFLAAATELLDLGVSGITTSCGFLISLQQRLAKSLPVPVATSSLLQYPMIRALLPSDQSIGIITFSAAALTREHLQAANIPKAVPVVGLDDFDSHLRRVILGHEAALDVRRAEQDMYSAARQLQRITPKLGAILLECTNMAPYSASLREATGLPIFDMVGFVKQFYASLPAKPLL